MVAVVQVIFLCSGIIENHTGSADRQFSKSNLIGFCRPLCQ